MSIHPVYVYSVTIYLFIFIYFALFDVFQVRVSQRAVTTTTVEFAPSAQGTNRRKKWRIGDEMSV